MIQVAFRFSACIFLLSPLSISGQDDTQAVLNHAKELETSVRATVNRLARIALNSSARRHERQFAIIRLGELKSSEAVGPLLKCLLFSSDLALEPGPLDAFPAAEALVKFGSLIYPSLWNELGKDRPDDYLRVVAFVMEQIDGRNLAVQRVRQELSGSDSEAQRGNLQRLDEVLRLTDFRDVKQWPSRRRPGGTDE